MNANLSPKQTLRLVVTIDTEEEGLWSGDYPKTGEVTNIRGVPRFQELCDRFGVRPTYLVDAPVVQSAEAVSILRPIQDDDRAEIGTHLHPWNNPPTIEQRCSRNSYLCNLPAELQRQKIEWLTDAIESAFGRRPRSFRAGRYGLDICGARILERLGYCVDSSVIPLTDYSVGGGPDFRLRSADSLLRRRGRVNGTADVGKTLRGAGDSRFYSSLVRAGRLAAIQGTRAFASPTADRWDSRSIGFGDSGQAEPRASQRQTNVRLGAPPGTHEAARSWS